jgi:uncharacterized membrane protein
MTLIAKLHPLFVHLSIGLVLAGAVAEFAASRAGSPSFTTLRCSAACSA